jgi:hypothetical protein
MKYKNIAFAVLVSCTLASCNFLSDSEGTRKLATEADVSNYLASQYPEKMPDSNKGNAGYDIHFPYTNGNSLPKFEKALLEAYLNHSSDLTLAKNLADIHVKKSGLHNKKLIITNGESLRHSILAQYFLERAIELGDKSPVTTASLMSVTKGLDSLFKTDSVIENDWTRESHQYFIHAFNYEEKNRHIAADRLLEDFLVQPNNVFTSFYIEAVTLWNGSESAYDDPTILYNYLVSSYFSLHAMSLAKTLEKNWIQNPEQYRPFRLAHILGGVSIVQRRWLATLHNDQAAIQLIDDEHWAWYKVSPVFHGYTLAVTMFHEPQNYQKAFQSIADGMLVDCFKTPDIRTCKDSARLSFNTLGVTLSVIDYMARMGATDKAKEFLGAKNNPEFHYAGWDLGRAAWEYREKNIDDMTRRFHNDNPDDDPLMFGLKAKKWGTSVLTCQYCHQAQSRQWTEEEKNYIQLPTAATTKLAQWPMVSTTWFGTVKK